MAVRIGHASIDENGKIYGGKVGDQTGKEVCIRNWYNKGWEFVARAKDPAVAEKLAAAMEAACANPNIGYDQLARNTLMTQAKAVGYDLSKIATPCECDCSSLVSVCVRAAVGRNYYTGNAPTTRTLKKTLTSLGGFEILTDSKYLAGTDYLRRGDILCKAGSHTVMVLDDGVAAGTGSIPSTPMEDPATYTVTLPVLQKGSKGAAVRLLQTLLISCGYSCGNAGVDGDFGSGTENALECFQEDNGLQVNSKCGTTVWAKLLGV